MRGRVVVANTRRNWLIVGGAWLLAAALVGWANSGRSATSVARPKSVDKRKAAVTADEDSPIEELPALLVLPSELPTELRRRDLELGLDKVRAHALRCQDEEQHTGTVWARLLITPSGQVESTHILPPMNETSTGRCIARTLSAATFPRFSGTVIAKLEWTVPIHLPVRK